MGCGGCVRRDWEGVGLVSLSELGGCVSGGLESRE